MRDIISICPRCKKLEFLIMECDDGSSSGLCFSSESIWSGECNNCQYVQSNINEEEFNEYNMGE